MRDFVSRSGVITKKVETWLALAQEDLDFAEEVLQNKKRPHYAAHLCHQSIEKLIKAIVQAETSSVPQFTHNFKLLCKQGKLELPENRMQWLMDLMPHYLGTRYPEDILKLKKRYTQVFCEKLFQETKEFFQWLKSVYLK